jgi:ABC-type transport system substrate-binding protein
MRATALRWLAAAALVFGLVGGHAGPAAAQGELRVAIPWTPENLDPTMNLSSLRSQVGVSIFDSLVPGLRVHRVASTWQIYLGLNAFRKPLSDVRVRQALNYATDVDSIIKNVLDGNGRRLDGPFTAGVFGFDASVKGYAPDPARARRLLAEAGYPDGLEITLDAEWGACFKKYLGKQMQDAYLLGLGGPMQDGDELYSLVSSKGRGLYYKNEKVDELFDQGRSTTDPAKRRKIYADLARFMVEDAT